jgi:hypothetical protein
MLPTNPDELAAQLVDHTGDAKPQCCRDGKRIVEDLLGQRGSDCALWV